jgi:Mn-dependent DtxR family transcriptional regulator
MRKRLTTLDITNICTYNERKFKEQKMSKDDKVLEFAKKYKESHNGNSPSYDEVAKACGIWKSQVKEIVDRLENKGLLERDGTRGIKIPNSKWTYEEA